MMTIAAMEREDMTEIKLTIREEKRKLFERLLGIVHCKDCKYQHKLGGRSGWCDRAVVDAGDYVKGIVNANDDDYCSYGERKDG